MTTSTTTDSSRENATLVFEEKNAVLHTIRARVLTIQSWYCGGALAMSAWTVTEQSHLSASSNIIILIGILIAGAAVTFMIANDHKGFKSNRMALARAEETLGLFDPVPNLPSLGPLYPTTWRNPGAGGNFFTSVYAIIVTFTLFALGTQAYQVATRPDPANVTLPKIPDSQVTAANCPPPEPTPHKVERLECPSSSE